MHTYPPPPLLCPCSDTHKTHTHFACPHVYINTRSHPTCWHVNRFTVCAAHRPTLALFPFKDKRKQVHWTETRLYGSIWCTNTGHTHTQTPSRCPILTIRTHTVSQRCQTFSLWGSWGWGWKELSCLTPPDREEKRERERGEGMNGERRWNRATKKHCQLQGSGCISLIQAPTLKSMGTHPPPLPFLFDPGSVTTAKHILDRAAMISTALMLYRCWNRQNLVYMQEAL